MEVLVDRERELGLLEREYREPGFRLLVVYGRRRVGKTFLLRWFCRGRPCVYYVAAELPYESLAREFSLAVKEALGLPVAGDVVEVLEALARLHRGGGKLVVVLDEFQYLVEADPSLPSRLMRSIDTALKGSGMMLVLCGSSVSFFEKRLLGYRAPLYGRRTGQLRLRPMAFWEAWGFNPGLTAVEAARLYGVAGGTPAYLALLGPGASAEKLVEEATRPGSPLLDEPVLLLRQELREPRTYLALLRAVAEGRVEPSEAAQAAGVDPRSIGRYIEVLEELDLVGRVRPLGRRRPVQLRFRDNFFRFWFSFILPLRSLIESGAVEKARRAILGELDSYMGRAFEETIVPQLAARMVERGILPLEPRQAGPWWRRGMEIDLVLRSPGRATAFIEAKWARLSRADARRALEKLEEKAGETGLASPRNYYVLVARGLDEPILEEHHIAVDLEWLHHNRVIEPAAARTAQR
ncbi:ATP-binding protein [Pyrodictium abyssi]|uniref:ATP-binding protein n=1 Tax=Pyrodictium abyssi TaxID=54256 RepID=A0ABN6ZNA8_9CREN|nr:ATP-binding protein [Pyrodictium abyssi]